MKIEKKSSPMPQWLDKLASAMQMKRTAELNVESLPTVTWKDETFYVNFTEDGNAVLYNRFGNKVSAIDYAKTMDDVQNFLDRDSIVAEADDESSEVTADAGQDEQPESQPGEEQQSSVSEPLPGTTSAPTEASADGEFEDELGRVLNDEEEVGDDQGEAKVAEVSCDESTEDEQHKQSYSELFAIVESLQRTVQALTEQQYARQEIPNDTYDLNCQDTEVEHFTESAAATQAVIDAEHALDLSKQSDRAKLNYNFLDSIGLGDEVKQQIIDGVEQQLNVIDVPEQVIDAPVVDELIEEPVIDGPIVDELVVEDVTPGEPVVDEPIVEDVVDTPEITELDDEADLESFSNQICPFCGGTLDVIDVDEDHTIVVNCDGCDKIYAVVSDEESGESAVFYNK